MTARLITIPFSHYCEKARWALDRCGIAYVEDGHLPLFHWLATRRAAGTRTVPLVVDGDTVLTDSTDIIAWADARAPGALLPADPAVRADALALEDELDRDLGPAARRVAYWYTLPNPAARAAFAKHVPRWQTLAFRATQSIAVRVLQRGLNVTRAGVDRSLAKVEQVFARIDARLADGRRYLAGDRFSVADLTLASLAAPLVGPEHHPRMMRIDLGDEGNARRAATRARPAGQHVLRMYADERARRVAVTPLTPRVA